MSTAATNLRPWYFWIACGVAALAILIVALAFEPQSAKLGKEFGQTGRKANDTLSASDLKKLVDQEQKNLSELSRKAANKPEARAFNVELPADLDDLTRNYIIPNAWKSHFTQHVTLYDQQLTRIRDYLSRRSQFLNTPVSNLNTASDWFTVYVEQSASVLRPAMAKRIISPDVDLALKAANGIHEALGFTTKPDRFEEVQATLKTTAAKLSRRLRMTQHVFEVIAASPGKVAVNPIASKANDLQPGAVLPMITGISWGVGGDGQNREGPIPFAESAQIPGAQGASSYSMTITLRGPLAALTAAGAALEANQREDRPIVIVTGTAITRRKEFAAGDRRDVASEELVATYHLSFLDFALAKTAETNP